MLQLDGELEVCRDEANVRDCELQATRELVTVLQQHVSSCQQQLDTQSVVWLLIELRLLYREQLGITILLGFLRSLDMPRTISLYQMLSGQWFTYQSLHCYEKFSSFQLYLYGS